MYLKVVITRSFAEIVVAATRYPPQEGADTDLAKLELLFGNR